MLADNKQGLHELAVFMLYQELPRNNLFPPRAICISIHRTARRYGSHTENLYHPDTSS
jgi:hypothetical protein